jgi:hypothetical protein
LARASSRNAAAASLEPPPNPAATGSRFESRKRPTLTRHTLGERVSGLEHEIVSALAAPGRHWPAHRKREMRSA